ncbi:LysM peptidoglycan-binding domain-containing protein [Pseudonocardia spinosispora]|uniref:LysM peptidoglycan-binding domain-containing protein n=1 Tax=Pseudonocardia spinosispora TaxID=103441 RepID=UPI0012EB5894|nr:LysM peptidoglycan-binding domain-containing protein [Pseudonocardia spinosispora]
MGGLLVGGMLWLPTTAPRAQGPALPPTASTATEDQWAAQVSTNIAALRPQIAELTRVRALWDAHPARLRDPRPDAVVLLGQRLAELTEQRALLSSRLDSATDLHALGLELAEITRDGARLDYAISLAPDSGDLTSQDNADLQRLRQLRRANAAREKTKIAQLDQLRTDVRAAMNAPMPNPDPATTNTLAAIVRDYVQHPERPRPPARRPANALSPRRDATEPRETASSPTRRDVHVGAPPRPGRETEPEHAGQGARLRTQQPNKSNAGSSASTYQVRPGDSLWKIAGTQLGDPQRWPELFGLNRGRTQSDGTALTDPATIRVGWTLNLPNHAAPRSGHSAREGGR